ncbi:MAG: VanZ family protein [Paludibacteraceae bacterium]|nr:VanZ family protein [Paludibacteraceae bacterium]
MASKPLICTSGTRKRWWHFLPSLLVLIGITYMSLIKEVPFAVMGDIPLADKWGHMVAYMLLAICLAGDGCRARISVRAIYTVAVLLPLIYGGLMEWIQYYFPPRMCEWLDWLADAIGTAAGVGLFAVYHLLNSRKAEQLPQP